MSLCNLLDYCRAAWSAGTGRVGRAQRAPPFAIQPILVGLVTTLRLVPLDPPYIWLPRCQVRRVVLAAAARIAAGRHGARVVPVPAADLDVLLPPRRRVDGRVRGRLSPPAAGRADRLAQPQHGAEMVWTGIPVAIVVVLFYRGFTGYMDMRTAPEDAREVRVTGKQWTMALRVSRRLQRRRPARPGRRAGAAGMSSEDVIHSLFIPDIAVKMDVVPGRYSRAWFCARSRAIIGIVCSEYCGSNHSDMVARLVVHPPGEYEKWLAAAGEKSRT